MKKKKINDLSFEITYVINSPLGNIGEDRYNQEIMGNIIEVDDYGKKIGEVGTIKANKILLGEATNALCHSRDVFDVTASIFNVGNEIYDYASGELKEIIQDFYGGEAYGDCILLLSRIEINPAYRGMGIGKHAIKDLYINFNQGAMIFVLQCFPIQHEAGILESSNDQVQLMEYNKFEKNYERSFEKLQQYYKGIGFSTIPDINNEIMFINPRLRNKKFELIKFL